MLDRLTTRKVQHTKFDRNSLNFLLNLQILEKIAVSMYVKGLYSKIWGSKFI